MCRLQPGRTKGGQEPPFDQVEINNIGKLFEQIRRQPKDLEPFNFMGESYRPKEEQCVSQEPHMRGAVCFSGLKYNAEVSRRLITAKLLIFLGPQYSCPLCMSL
jgi:hypothetical protein